MYAKAAHLSGRRAAKRPLPHAPAVFIKAARWAHSSIFRRFITSLTGWAPPLTATLGAQFPNARDANHPFRQWLATLIKAQNWRNVSPQPLRVAFGPRLAEPVFGPT